MDSGGKQQSTVRRRTVNTELALPNTEMSLKEENGALDDTTMDIEFRDDKDPNKKVVSRSTYAAKKTVAQGMMDIALITANANQLRYLLEFQSNSPTFYVTLVLIIISLILQVAVGISLIFKGRFDLKGEEKLFAANQMNNYVVVGVFLITIINVFIASFSITGDRPIVGPPALPAPAT